MSLFLAFFPLLCPLNDSFSAFAPAAIKDNPVALWAKINQIPVCFHAQGRRPGMFHYLGEGKLVGAIKLVFVRGSVRCANDPKFSSRWGCYRHPDNFRHPLNVVVTDADNHVIYPAEKYIMNTGLWYYLPFTDAKSSNQLVYTDYANPFYLEKYATIKIWYGEDLMKYDNHDNRGRVCVHVWAHLM